jgi:Ran GTPase-activating protein (RanGAP) involved in mRNA processing and transport
VRSDGVHLGARALCEILDAVPKLTSLTLDDNRLSDVDAQILVRALADSGRADGMSKLSLSHNEVGDGTAKLLSEGALPNLEHLHLKNNCIADEGAQALANAQWPKLSRLSLANNAFGDEGVEAIALALCADGNLNGVYYFSLDSFQFTLGDLRSTSTVELIGGAVKELQLAGVDEDGKQRAKMSDRDLVVVSTMLGVPGILPLLEILRLDDNDLGAGGMAALGGTLSAASSDALRHVGKLYLQRNHLGNLGLKLLAKPLGAGGMPRLAEVHLAFNGIGDAGAHHLAAALAANGLPELTLLNLSRNEIGDEGCTALAKAALLPEAAGGDSTPKENLAKDGMRAAPMSKLTALYLIGNQIGDAGCTAMGAALGADCWPKLSQLHLGANAISESAKAELHADAGLRPPAGQGAGALEPHLPIARPDGKRAKLVIDWS